MKIQRVLLKLFKIVLGEKMAYNLVQRCISIYGFLYPR